LLNSTHHVGKQFKFRGCGWKLANSPKIGDEDAKWLAAMQNLMEKVIGSDFLEYFFDKSSGVKVVEKMIPTYKYHHDSWEEEYDILFQTICQPEFNSTKGPIKKKARKSLFNTSLTEDNSASNPTPMETEDHTDVQSCPEQLSATKDKKTTKQVPKTAGKASSCTTNSSYQLQCPVDAALSTHDLNICKSSSRATRQQLANVILPNVENVGNGKISVVSKPSQLLDAYSITTRPSKTSLNYAEKLLTKLRKDGMSPNNYAVKFGNIGIFDVDSLSTLHKFCEISDVRHAVISEVQWLNIDDGLDVNNIMKLSSALLENEPTKVIIKVTCGSNTIAVDTISFAYLIGERYVDNMMIDVCLYKYMLDLNDQGQFQTLLFPNSVWTWESGNEDHLKTQIEACISHCKVTTTGTLQIVIPVYMNKHWGIIFVDFKDNTMYFDDGLKRKIPKGTLSALKHILDIVQVVLMPSTTTAVWWSTVQSLQRLGMPRQDAKDAVQSNQGSGSCGIGVVLAGKELMENGSTAINNFSWSFARSRYHRKQLMIQILKWAQ